METEEERRANQGMDLDFIRISFEFNFGVFKIKGMRLLGTIFLDVIELLRHVFDHKYTHN